MTDNTVTRIDAQVLATLIAWGYETGGDFNEALAVTTSLNGIELSDEEIELYEIPFRAEFPG